MKTRILHIALCVIFLYGGTFAAAPMMFCRMNQAAENVPDCCKKKQKVVSSTQCGDQSSTCPICAHRLCAQDPAPSKLATESAPQSSLVLFTVLPFESFTIGVGYSHVIASDHNLTDSSPPTYLANCTFRI